MIFSLEVIRARKGDCLMLHYGTPEDLRLMMIDGGPRGVYAPHLKPRIEQIRTGLQTPPNKPLDVEILMVSHVDDDHIQGILDLTSDLKTAIEQHKPQLVQVFFFWHNSFEDVIGKTPPELTTALTTEFGPASIGGEPPEMTLDLDDEDEETIVSSLKVLASIKQGQQLRSDIINKLDAKLNFEFDGNLILAQENTKPLDVGNGLNLTVVGPMLEELQNLQAEHQKWLEDLKKEGKTAEDVLVAYVDKSVPNLSSVVVLAEAGGKRILLTGDARGDKILEGLELVGRVEEGGTLEVDILKVPHHGSSNNLDDDFFEHIIARHYIFSGNGEHGNPERESLEMLLRARREEDYTVHLTYPIDEIDVARQAEWEKQQASEKKRRENAIKKGKPGKKVREDWSHEEHSLAALCNANPDFANKVRIVQEGGPHVINLLDDFDF
jgi:hypothetical protein